jgi:thymidylate synthase (FAD)
VTEFELVNPRRQDTKNRQNSTDDLNDEVKTWFKNAQDEINGFSIARYKIAIDNGIAKESARFLLPLNTQTKLYMNGTIRSWLHYLDVRCGPETQLEHREIALTIKDIFVQQLPNIAEAKGWINEKK